MEESSSARRDWQFTQPVFGMSGADFVQNKPKGTRRGECKEGQKVVDKTFECMKVDDSVGWRNDSPKLTA